LRDLGKAPSPLLARSLRRAQVLALSLLSRGFLEARQRAAPRWPWPQRLVFLLLILAGISLLAAKGAYLLAEQGIYDEQWRVLYDFARRCL
jgi:energy-coupling factor transport system permease protein